MNPETEAWDERHISVLSGVRIRPFMPHVGSRGLRLFQIPNRAHRETCPQCFAQRCWRGWDHRRAPELKAARWSDWSNSPKQFGRKMTGRNIFPEALAEIFLPQIFLPTSNKEILEKGPSKLISAVIPIAFGCFRGAPEPAVFHLSGPGCRPSRVTGFGGAWDAMGRRMRVVQAMAGCGRFSVARRHDRHFAPPKPLSGLRSDLSKPRLVPPEPRLVLLKTRLFSP
jgi:hypothetical protein